MAAMRFQFMLVGLLLMPLLGWGRIEQKGALRFDAALYDLGSYKILPTEPPKTDARFANGSQKDITIDGFRMSCGCVVADISERLPITLKPGTSQLFSFRLNPLLINKGVHSFRATAISNGNIVGEAEVRYAYTPDGEFDTSELVIFREAGKEASRSTTLTLSEQIKDLPLRLECSDERLRIEMGELQGSHRSIQLTALPTGISGDRRVTVFAYVGTQRLPIARLLVSIAEGSLLSKVPRILILPKLGSLPASRTVKIASSAKIKGVRAAGAWGTDFELSKVVIKSDSLAELEITQIQREALPTRKTLSIVVTTDAGDIRESIQVVAE